MMTQEISCLLNNEGSRTDVSLGGNILLLCLQNPGTEKMLSNRYPEDHSLRLLNESGDCIKLLKQPSSPNWGKVFSNG